MASEWNARVELSDEEEAILALCGKQKLWGFVRRHRHQILDDDVRTALHGMYDTGERGGRPPEAPERLALAMLLQVGFGTADHEVPLLTAVDRRWQMALDCLGATEPVFSQGTVFAFRERARKHGLAALLLSKTVELARSTKEFDHKRLRALIDSSPLVGAGRVEDTFNLLGRAIAQLVDVVAEERSIEADALAAELAISVVGANSVKAALDIDWRKPEARSKALATLIEQFERLRTWLSENVPAKQLEEPPLSEHIATVEQIIAQDTEPDPNPGGGGRARRIREGVSPDRLISLGDKEMRHGRKSKTRTFNGYKRHVIVDADVKGLICGVEVLPANRHEHEAAPLLLRQLAEAGFGLTELHIDRGYLPAPEVSQMHDAGLAVITKPSTPARTEHFSKDDFVIDFANEIVTCPAGATTRLRLGKTVAFPIGECRDCKLRSSCTTSRQRQLSIHEREAWHREMAAELSTQEGRAKRRERIPVEHTLARVSAIQGNRARFKGLDKNRFDLQRVAILNNYYVLAALQAAA